MTDAQTPVTLGTPIVTAATPDPVVTHNAPTDGLGQTVFPVGTTIVTWTVTDGNAQTAKALQRVTVYPAGGSLVFWGLPGGYVSDVPAGTDYVTLDTGSYHGLALRADGSMVGWGENSYGQRTPRAGTDFVAVSTGLMFSVALKADGSVVAWGCDTQGQTTVPAGDDFVDVSAGWNFALALKEDGSLVAWGATVDGQCAVPGGNDYVRIAAGAFHGVALKADGSVVAWGRNNTNQCAVPEGDDYVAIEADIYQSVALHEDGSLIVWGGNPTPSTPLAGDDYTAAGIGFYVTVGLHEDGTLAASPGGDNGMSNVPDGTFVAFSIAYNAGGVAITTPPIYQPDLQIKGPNDAEFLGAHFYYGEEDPGQTAMATTTGTAIYHLLLGNDGNTADTLTLFGPAGDGGWAVRYFDAEEGGEEITAAVTSEDGWPVAVGLTEPVPVRVEVTADATVLGNVTFDAALTAQSAHDPATADLVIARTTKQALTSVALEVGPAVRVLTGQALTLTAVAEGGGSLEYLFKAKYYTAAGTLVWVPIRDYAPAASCAWTPPMVEDYTVYVYAREQGKTSAKYGTKPVTVAPPLSAVAVSISPAAPQPQGTALTLTAVPTGGANLEYLFKAKYYDAVGTLVWLPIREYAAAKTCAWTPPLMEDYTVYVYAREQGTTSAKYGTKVYKVITSLSGVTLEVTPAATPVTVGTALTLTATPTGGTLLEYLFKAKYVDGTGATVWVPIQDYDPGAEVVWTPELAKRYTIYVFAREQGSTAAYQKLAYASCIVRAP